MKKANTPIEVENIDLDIFSKDYISYAETIKALRTTKPTLQQHLRQGKKFTEPGDTLILPDKKRVFRRSAVQREIANILHANGVRNL